MKEQKDILHIRVVKDAIEAIGRYTAGMDEPSFCANELVRDATLMRLIVVGEYLGKVSDKTRLAYPEIDWSGWRRARDYYSHGYGGVDWPWVWETISADLPALAPQIENLYGELEKEN